MIGGSEFDYLIRGVPQMVWLFLRGPERISHVLFFTLPFSYPCPIINA
jgi:hypothetical protein